MIDNEDNQGKRRFARGSLAPVPAQAADHPANCHPEAGEAVKATEAPWGYLPSAPGDGLRLTVPWPTVLNVRV